MGYGVSNHCRSIGVNILNFDWLWNYGFNTIIWSHSIKEVRSTSLLSILLREACSHN
jgi:hypothetical protein